MSKYIKLYDAIMAMDEWFSEPITPTKILSDLPTIEVSEEVLKATKKFNAYTIADENADMGMRTQIEPIIEVSEDCISREELLKHAYKREGVLSVSVDSIKLAPSVVPKERAEE